jgi:hypothetical protein
MTGSHAFFHRGREPDGCVRHAERLCDVMHWQTGPNHSRADKSGWPEVRMLRRWWGMLSPSRRS